MVSARESVVAAMSRIIERRRPALPGVAEIAREAGVSRPTFYAYFPTSTSAFEAVVTHVRDRVLAIQEDADTSSVPATLESTLVAMLDLTVEHLGLLTQMASEARTDPRVSELWHDIHDRPIRRHARFIDRLAVDGLADPAIPSLAIAEGVDGVMTRYAHLISEDPSRRDQLARDLTRLHTRLIGLGQADTGPRGEPSSQTPEPVTQSLSAE